MLPPKAARGGVGRAGQHVGLESPMSHASTLACSPLLTSKGRGRPASCSSSSAASSPPRRVGVRLQHPQVVPVQDRRPHPVEGLWPRDDRRVARAAGDGSSPTSRKGEMTTQRSASSGSGHASLRRGPMAMSWPAREGFRARRSERPRTVSAMSSTSSRRDVAERSHRHLGQGVDEVSGRVGAICPGSEASSSTISTVSHDRSPVRLRLSTSRR